MAFTAADVKNLREMTGVGMMDCKKALGETNGDMEAAVTLHLELRLFHPPLHCSHNEWVLSDSLRGSDEGGHDALLERVPCS